MVIQAVVEEERPAVNQPVGVGEVDNRMEGKQDRQDKSQVRIILFYFLRIFLLFFFSEFSRVLAYFKLFFLLKYFFFRLN